MKKNSTSLRNSGTYTSPRTPDYGNNNEGPIQKGWCSERVPISNGSRRHISASGFMPFNSGRALPSKWDDAERWIRSPLSSHGLNKTKVAHTHRQTKSKSGPLQIPGLAYLSNYSPVLPLLEAGTTRNFNVGSPFTTDLPVADGLSVHYGGGIGTKASPVGAENGVAQSSTVATWSELLAESSLMNARDAKIDSTKDAETVLSPVVYQRDMATQMSPMGSTHSSPEGRSSSFSTSLPSVSAVVELCSGTGSIKEEIRDVEIDKADNLTRHSKRHGLRSTNKASPPWGIAEGAENMTRLQREESKINAWENLQKAKAEAAIQKLEMKLEKERSASVDKILNKLRVAQVKAQEGRRFLSESSGNRAHKTSRKGLCLRKYVKMGSLCGCFTCHAC
ncbi:hypothetical protein LguiB_019432 [Lonicera macranthoides]